MRWSLYRRARAHPRRGEDGFALIEAVGALSILAVGFVALGAGLTVGFRQIAESRQRQVAAEVATSRLEHLRNVPYENVALSTALTHSNDPGHPDFHVSQDGLTYDVVGDGMHQETLVVAPDGLVLHEEAPVTIGTTIITTFMYVTWVDDANVPGPENYRRATTVQMVENPASQGAPRFLRSSSVFSTGVVQLGGATPGATPGSPGPSASPTASPAPTTCTDTNDTTPPQGEFEVLAGAAETGFTASPEVTLRFLDVSDPCAPITLEFSNDGVTYNVAVTYEAQNPAIAWVLTGGDGTKTIRGRIRDGRGNSRSMTSRSINLDATRPTVPGTLSHSSISCQGTNRTINLQWGSSSDTNFRGYRVYRSVNNAPFSTLTTTSVTQVSDTHAKSLDSVRFYVVGYDRAGNESSPTNTVVYAKNRCS